MRFQNASGLTECPRAFSSRTMASQRYSSAGASWMRFTAELRNALTVPRIPIRQGSTLPRNQNPSG